MMLIGVDPHKSTHTATAVDPATTSTDSGSVRIEASNAGYRELMRWARQWSERSWAGENAEGFGHAAAASIAALHGDARPVHPETHADSLALLDERPKNLPSTRTRSVNQLHALLRELLPGGAPTDLTAVKAAAVLRGLRPVTATDRVRRSLAKDLLADIKRYDTQLSDDAAAMEELLDLHGTTLREIPGIGPVMAARLIGRTGRAARFATAAAYANYTGVAPVEIASADVTRHRLSRYGDRELNSALHTIAMVQIRMRGSTGRAYYDKKVRHEALDVRREVQDLSRSAVAAAGLKLGAA
ncbi:transposase [Nocardia gipuzkoensis]